MNLVYHGIYILAYRSIAYGVYWQFIGFVVIFSLQLICGIGLVTSMIMGGA